MTVVKICGVRRARDAELAARLGARRIGCVLAEDSPRRATTQQVRAVSRAVVGAVDVVLVFRRPVIDSVRRACEDTGVGHVQLHRAATGLAETLRGDGLAVTTAVEVVAGQRHLPPIAPPPGGDGSVLLDRGAGGGGRVFDWQMLAPRAPRGVWIAGGIDATNVKGLLRYRPFGIDLSSGVECAPGVKDADALRRLFAVVGVEER